LAAELRPESLGSLQSFPDPLAEFQRPLRGRGRRGRIGREEKGRDGRKGGRE